MCSLIQQPLHKTRQDAFGLGLGLAKGSKVDSKFTLAHGRGQDSIAFI